MSDTHETPSQADAGAVRFVLASGSPRRRELLAQIGVVPDAVDPPDADETPKRGELPTEYARRVTLEKLAIAAARHPGAVVLAADTVVAAGRRILPKAADEAEIAACLRLLSGRRHKVTTAVAVAAPDGRVRERLVTSIVALPALTEGEIADYAATGEGIGKAGGYAIQGRGGALCRWMSGSHSAIVGLPLFETRTLLRAAGLAIA